jgi:hypothetical protein
LENKTDGKNAKPKKIPQKFNVYSENGTENTLQISITKPDKLHLKVTGFRGDCAGDKKGYIECLTQGGTQGYSWKLDPFKSPIEKEPDGLHSVFRNLPTANTIGIDRNSM